MAAAKTIRQQIIFLLRQQEMTAADLSHSLGIKEKEVHEHLPHISRSAIAQGRTLQIRPSACLKCGFVFRDRTRFTPPGRCPRCKGTFLRKPAFKITRKG